RTRRSTGPVRIPEPFGFTSRAAGVTAMIWSKRTLTTWIAVQPCAPADTPGENETCTGDWKPLPKIVMRVPPSIGPESGLTVETIGVSTSAWKTNGDGDVARCSLFVPAPLTTTIVAF